MKEGDLEARMQRVDRVLGSRIYKSGEPFTCTYLATQLMGLNPKQCREVLNFMENQGLVVKHVKSAVAWYTRKATSLQSVSWRHDEEIYDILQDIDDSIREAW